MHTSRRKFIKQAGLTITGTALLSNYLMAAPKGQELLGVQLYSVRADMTKDPLGTLKQIAAMGYKNVEHANYINRKFYGYTASEFKKILNDLGLKMPSGHTVMGSQHWDAAKNDFADSWKWTVEDAATLGQMFVISPSLPNNMRKSYDELLKAMEMFNKSGELCKKSGMKFGYHNHDFEFSEKLNGETLFDI
ncbi:MAG TPA: TIM barrel protein, partial [Flavitalea sp.]|nr:TIM barrel protein [Flavitalea sp.]